MPQDWFLQLPKREYEGPIQLPQTPLSETNPWLDKIVRFGRGLTGIGSTEGGMMGQGTPDNYELAGEAAGQFNPQKLLMAPLVGMTRFMNLTNDAGKLVKTPDVARRMLRTSERMDQLRQTLENAGAAPNDIEKAMEIAGRYPRTLAHTETIDLMNPRDMKLPQRAAGVTHTPKGRVMPDLLINRNPEPHIAANTQVNQHHQAPVPSDQLTPYAQTFAHELQHVGQIIPGAERMIQGYNQAQRTHGYKNNPYETAARLGSIKRAYGHLTSVANMFRRKN